MERYKFRALKDDMSNCNFVYGQLVYDAAGNPRITAVDSSGKGLLFHTCLKGTEGQYTGLKDKNGKEIYEGNSCKCRMNGIETHVEEVETEVIYDLTVGAFGHKVISKDSDYKFFGLNSKNLLSCEIIGNIHEQLNKG